MLSQLGSNSVSHVDGSDIHSISYHRELCTSYLPGSYIENQSNISCYHNGRLSWRAATTDAEGLDRPSENEAQLDDLHDEFDEPSRVEAADPAGPDSDDESLLSELDEAQFADFDPTAVQVAPDFDTLNKAIKVKKR